MFAGLGCRLDISGSYAGRVTRRFLRRAQSSGLLAGGQPGQPGGSLPGSRPGRRIAAFGAVAVLGLVLHTSAPVTAGRPAGRAVPRTVAQPGSAAHPAAAARPAHVVPGTGPGQAGQAGPGPASGGGAADSPVAATGKHASATSSFRQIILPDLLIVAPKGLSASQISRLRAIHSVRNMITFDGAEITAGGRAVSVIGVNPATFRSWVPLKTASDQAFWNALSAGDFAASAGTTASLGLKPGRFYQLQGASAQTVKFGLGARLGLSGVDLLVNQATSAKLGLVRQVAGLISAPGASLATLRARVSKILGPTGRVVVLRGQLPVASVPAGSQPASYLELFKASAAQYCPGLSWTVLAAIGQIESADGQNMGPSTAGALGPMQFMPATWAQWGIDGFGDTGTPDVMNPYDAVPSAARLLCADGAAAGGQSLYHAIFDYNHADWYVNEVLSLAAEYAADYR